MDRGTNPTKYVEGSRLGPEAEVSSKNAFWASAVGSVPYGTSLPADVTRLTPLGVHVTPWPVAAADGETTAGAAPLRAA
jgi:hypothetical protein